MKSMSKPIRIGTRDSALAMWQANLAANLLQGLGHAIEIVPIKSEGDLDLITPLYAMGVQGVFTRALDVALLQGRIDVAVHSMKDVPIQLPQGIQQAAVLPRADNRDFLVTHNPNIHNIDQIPNTSDWIVATSSIRRRAQWQHRFPEHQFVDLRGNIATRLQKLHDQAWNAAVFAGAALERLEIQDQNIIPLDWMISAPAQGAILMVCRTEDHTLHNLCTTLNHLSTAQEVLAERDFLNALMGGCATPIAASAKIIKDTLYFKGNVLSPDGQYKIEVDGQYDRSEFEEAGRLAALRAIHKGALELLKYAN